MGGQYKFKYYAASKAKTRAILAEFRKDGCKFCGEKDPVCV